MPFWRGLPVIEVGEGPGLWRHGARAVLERLRPGEAARGRADERSATKTALLYNWPVTTVRKAFRRIRAGGPFYRWSSVRRSATEEKLTEVERILEEDPQVSVRKMARAPGLTRSTMWRVTHTYLKKNCYHRAKTLALKVQPTEQRLKWCKILMTRLGSDFTDAEDAALHWSEEDP